MSSTTPQGGAGSRLSFENISIQTKIFIGFAVVGALFLLLALFAFINLTRMQTSTDKLSPRLQETEYRQRINLAMETLDHDLERYTTVGGEAHREAIEADFKAIEENADHLLELFADDPGISTLLKAQQERRDALYQHIQQLVLLQEGLEKRGINQQIIKVFAELESLRNARAEVSETLDAHFVQLVQEQDRLIRGIILQLGVFIMVVIAGGIFISYQLAKAITDPILRLRDTVAKIAAGDYEARAHEAGKNEVSELAMATNRMAENLRAYTTDLESKIAERTTQLEKNLAELDESNKRLSQSRAELTEANNRLQELDKVKSEFISVAAHQLRTPLSAIKWTLSILVDESPEHMTAQQRSLLMKAYESNERIINLINEMLIVSRIESGKIKYKLTTGYIEDVIESVILDFAGQAHVRNIRLALDKNNERKRVRLDADNIRNVVQNLIENAMRYVPDGGVIDVRVRPETDHVVVSVADNGIGIPENQKINIFNKFFRADNAVKVRTDGTGLGLFISKSVVEWHGGHIWFDSTEGRGTTFYFTLPRVIDEQSSP